MKLVVLIGFIFSLSIAAQASDCRDLLLKEFGLAPTRTAIGWRGYLGSKPEATNENREKAEQLGLMHWGQRIYVLPTKEAILAHDQKQNNFLLKGVYLLGDVDPGTFIDSNKEVRKSEVKDAFAQLAKKGMFWVKNGKVVNIDSSAVKTRFLPEEISVILEPEGQGNFFYQSGWFAPARRGMIFFETLNEGNREVRQLARKLIEQGYKFTFNRGFAESVHMLSIQKRSVRDPKTGERTFTDELNNRFKDKEERDSLLNRFEKGTAISVELWNPEGKLVAGNIVLKSGNVFYPDTVFYDVTYNKNIIDYVKATILFLCDRLEKAGYSYVNAGMVSNMTADLGGFEVERAVHDVLMDVINKGTFHMDLNSEWEGPARRDAQ